VTDSKRSWRDSRATRLRPGTARNRIRNWLRAAWTPTASTSERVPRSRRRIFARRPSGRAGDSDARGHYTELMASAPTW